MASTLPVSRSGLGGGPESNSPRGHNEEVIGSTFPLESLESLESLALRALPESYSKVPSSDRGDTGCDSVLCRLCRPRSDRDAAYASLGGSYLGTMDVAGGSGATGASLLGRGVSMGRVVSIE